MTALFAYTLNKNISCYQRKKIVSKYCNFFIIITSEILGHYSSVMRPYFHCYSRISRQNTIQGLKISITLNNGIIHCCTLRNAMTPWAFNSSWFASHGIVGLTKKNSTTVTLPVWKLLLENCILPKERWSFFKSYYLLPSYLRLHLR